MSDTLIKTKFNIPPFQPNLISRPRLLNRLQDDLWQAGGFTRKLSLISAPAGYGKTTLIAEFCQQLQTSDHPVMDDLELDVCWLSLEDADNDQVRFLTYFIAALKNLEGTTGDTALGMLQSPQIPPLEVYLATLVNDIARFSQPVLFVIDDYHLVHTPAIHQMLNFILEHQPFQLHLILLSREDPPIPLPRLRAQGQVREIRQDDLRFNSREIAIYLQQGIGVSLDSKDLGALERRTEGWAAGLQLAALSMESRKDISTFIQEFTGSNRYILDYLIEEVFRNQSEEIQKFLLQVSILDRLSPPLCDFVVEKNNSRDILDHLEHSNLFIVALDEEHEWFRFHRLFAELLHHRLRVSRDHDEAQYHRRASLWFEENGNSADAVHHALMAKDWNRSAELIHEYSDGLLRGGRLGTLIRWVRQLPEQVIRTYPGVCGDYAWALLLIGDLDKAEPYLSHAATFHQQDSQYQGGIASAEAFLARSRGDFQGTIEKSEKALALLSTEDFATRSIVAINLGLTYWHAGMLDQADKALREARHSGDKSGNHYAAVAARVFIGRNAATRGHLHQAEETYKQIVQEGGPPPMLALTHLDLCGLNYEWNRLGIAQDHWQKGMDLCRRSGNIEFQVAAEMLLARLKLALGAVDAAEGAALRAYEMSQNFSPFTQARCASSLVQVALAKGDVKVAVEWAEKMEVDGDHFTFYMFLNLTRARIWIAQRKESKADEELSKCYEKASKGGWKYGVIATRVLQCMSAEDSNSAKEFLRDALSLAQSENFLRIFADHGGRIVPCLQGVLLEGASAEYVGKILTIIEGKGATPETGSLIEPLTQRELEVLRLLVAGLSNREMASTLVLSLGTVKTHVHNIYGKLGVRNRAEAIARTRELALL